MSCSGLHCAGCASGMAVPVVPVIACLGAAWVAEHLAVVAIMSATCGALAVAAVVALMRWGDRRERRHMAERPFLVTRPGPATLTATVIPQVSQPAQVPAVEQHIHFHLDPASPEAARIFRTAVPGIAGDVITERN